MKRNKEVVLKVLAVFEENYEVSGLSSIDFYDLCVKNCRDDELQSAKLLLLDSGYLVSDGDIRMTWAGHSLLEELRG